MPTPRGWTRPGIEARGTRSAEAVSGPHRRGQEPEPAGRADGRAGLRRCRSASASPRTRTIRRAIRRPQARRGSAFQRAIITCSRATSTIRSAGPTAHYIVELSKLAGLSDPRRPRRPNPRARDRHREGPVDARAAPRSGRDPQSDEPRAADEAGAAVQLDRDPQARSALAVPRRSTSPSRAPSPRPASASPTCRSAPGRNI